MSRVTPPACPAHKQQARTPGFSLIELLVVIAVIAILVTVLTPLIGKIRQKSHDIECLANLRRWGAIVTEYAADNGGSYAARGIDRSTGNWTSWGSARGPYADFFGSTSGQINAALPRARLCYGSGSTTGLNYVMNAPHWSNTTSSSMDRDPPAEAIPISMATTPSRLLLMMDSPAANGPHYMRTFNRFDIYEASVTSGPKRFAEMASSPWPRHSGGIHALFADGHVRKVYWEPLTPNDPDSILAQKDAWFVLDPRPRE